MRTTSFQPSRSKCAQSQARWWDDEYGGGGWIYVIDAGWWGMEKRVIYDCVIYILCWKLVWKRVWSAGQLSTCGFLDKYWSGGRGHTMTGTGWIRNGRKWQITTAAGQRRKWVEIFDMALATAEMRMKVNRKWWSHRTIYMEAVWLGGV